MRSRLFGNLLKIFFFQKIINNSKRRYETQNNKPKRISAIKHLGNIRQIRKMGSVECPESSQAGIEVDGYNSNHDDISSEYVDGFELHDVEYAADESCINTESENSEQPTKFIVDKTFSDIMLDGRKSAIIQQRNPNQTK